MVSAFHYSWKNTHFLCLCLLRIVCSKLTLSLKKLTFTVGYLVSAVEAWLSYLSSSLQKHLPPDGLGLPRPAAASTRFLFGPLSIHLPYAEEGGWGLIMVIMF